MCLPTQKMQEVWVQSPGQENPLEKEMAHSGPGNPMDGGTWLATVQGVRGVKYDSDWARSLGKKIKIVPRHLRGEEIQLTYL